jgi:hypothetical protein
LGKRKNSTSTREEVKTVGTCSPLLHSINKVMKKKASVFPNMVTYVPIRRRDWVLKISIFKNNSILVIGYNVFTFSSIVRQFDNADLAASFIDFMVEQEEI